MPRIKIDDSQPFAMFPAYVVRTKEKALEELQSPCTRFRSALTLEEKMRTVVSSIIGPIDMLANVDSIVAPGTPLNWQSLLRYLYERRFISKPEFTFNPLRNDLPKHFRVSIQTTWDPEQTDGMSVHSGGYAHAKDPEVALSKAVGETLERHVCTIYKVSSFQRMSFSEAQAGGIPVLNIFDLPTFLPWQQNKRARLSKDLHSPFYWVEGETYDGGPILLPAQLVYWSYDFERDKNEPVLGQTSTNAAGGHFTKDEAILSGLLENIQRDGFLIYWLNSLSPKRIDVSHIQDSELDDILSKIRRHGLEIHFLNTTTDVGVPSVTCAIIDRRTTEPMLAVGGGTGFDYKSTLVHAAYETLAVLHEAMHKEPFALPDRYEPFTDPQVGHMERIRLWRGKDMLAHFEFFLGGTTQSAEEFLGTLPIDMSPHGQLKHVVQKLRALGPGYELYLHEMRHEVLTKLGYHVVQTVVPKLIPIYLMENIATLDTPRLRDVPMQMGFTPAERLNPLPHPFP